jgi:multisubunit Na+/H+ antiporter MnhC subunit
MLGLLQLTTASSLVVQQTLLAEAAVNGVRVAIMLTSIAIGIAFPALVFDREKPVA